MLSMIQTLAAPLLSLILLIMGSGLFNTFIPIRLEMQGYTTEAIGFVTAALYAGILFGSLWIDRTIAWSGHKRSFLAFACFSAFLILAQGLWTHSLYWAALRFIGGICMAGIFIGIESWFLMQSTPSTRSSALSLYVVVFYGALSIGQLLIELSDPMSFFPFLIAAAFCFSSIAPLLIKKIAEPKISSPSKMSLIQLFRLSPLGFSGGVISGVILSVVYGLIPVYAKELGLSISQIGNLMAIIVFGGLSLQWPMGKLSDKKERKVVLRVASFFSMGFALLMGFIPPTSPFFLLIAWAFGGFSFTLYPLSMAYTCEKLTEEQIIPATGSFVLSYGIGAVIGPLIAPLAMTFAPSALFYFLAVISFPLTLIGLSKSVKIEEKVIEKDLEQ